jgi:flagellin
MVISLGTTNLSVGNSAVIGSYVTYTYGGSCNCSVAGSSHVAVRWHSVICGSLMSISNQTAAQAAIDKLGIAINHLGAVRATHGAEQSRLQYTLEGLRSYEDNLRAAESRIRDADIALETITFTKYQILVQAGAAMLAQANQLPNIARGCCSKRTGSVIEERRRKIFPPPSPLCVSGGGFGDKNIIPAAA